MGLFSNTVPFKGQKYKAIKNSCIKKGQLFVDPTFPCSGASLYFSKTAPKDIVWKRPGEIDANPKFFEAGVSSDDLTQGSLGNCWFVAACACLAEDSRLWEKIVPDYEEQEWNEKNKYAGIFHFKFWRCGQWIDVVIDDKLPTKDGELIFVKSKAKNEFWSALLEKAYAKLAGDYESLDGGTAKDALVDMTGGVGEGISMKDHKSQEQREKLFHTLRLSKENHSLMSAAISASDNEREDKLDCGLMKGHAYSVTAVKNIKLGTGLFSIFSRDYLQMIRLRNPWGDTEWNGAWSDGSPEWKKVSDSQKKELGIIFDDNGEFWMSFEGFCEYFTKIDVCHMFNTSFFSLSKQWHEAKVTGNWGRTERCGGCSNHATFLKNPQYIIDVTKDEDEVLLSLEQQDKRGEKGVDTFHIGCSIHKTDINRKYRMHDQLEKIFCDSFSASRSQFSRVKLKRGRYIVIPSTFDPGFCGDFVMRIYSSISLNLTELLYDEPKQKSCCCFSMKRKQVAATQITLEKAEGLKGSGSSDPYCIVKYEDGKVKNNHVSDTLNPEWNDRITLYRKKPTEDITIEIWDHNIIKDELMGIATLPMDKSRTYTERNTMYSYDLFIKGKKGMEPTQGKLWLTVIHSDDMATV